MTSMRILYPPIEPYATHTLTVDNHRIYFEECGSVNGLPVVFLHGGPGSGCRPYHRSFFCPDVYRIILVDQRGAGRSSPTGSLEKNDTNALIEDLERIRAKLGIQQWVLFGGSWGATLALLYAQSFPAHVLAMVLRGAFLAREKDLDWYLIDGANRIYPEQWNALKRFTDQQDAMAVARQLHSILHGNDELAKLRLAKAWEAWGAQLTLGEGFDATELDRRSTTLLLQQVGIELHYAVNRYFLRDNQVLEGCANLPQVPTYIVHGRHDFVCPPEAAYTLHQNVLGSELHIVAKAGHAAASPEIIDALVTVTDNLPRRMSS